MAKKVRIATETIFATANATKNFADAADNYKAAKAGINQAMRDAALARKVLLCVAARDKVETSKVAQVLGIEVEEQKFD